MEPSPQRPWDGAHLPLHKCESAERGLQDRGARHRGGLLRHLSGTPVGRGPQQGPPPVGSAAVPDDDVDCRGQPGAHAHQVQPRCGLLRDLRRLRGRDAALHLDPVHGGNHRAGPLPGGGPGPAAEPLRLSEQQPRGGGPVLHDPQGHGVDRGSRCLQTGGRSYVRHHAGRGEEGQLAVGGDDQRLPRAVQRHLAPHHGQRAVRGRAQVWDGGRGVDQRHIHQLLPLPEPSGGRRVPLLHARLHRQRLLLEPHGPDQRRRLLRHLPPGPHGHPLRHADRHPHRDVRPRDGQRVAVRQPLAGPANRLPGPHGHRDRRPRHPHREHHHPGPTADPHALQPLHHHHPRHRHRRGRHRHGDAHLVAVQPHGPAVQPLDPHTPQAQHRFRRQSDGHAQPEWNTHSAAVAPGHALRDPVRVPGAHQDRDHEDDDAPPLPIQHPHLHPHLPRQTHGKQLHPLAHPHPQADSHGPWQADVV
mmetsp:Transcript_114368/g.198890  ORF Transcript_114368/g.198890 Transcript_114368/m.198890 type:complete len:473 (+) Transcript_114368:2676-4094(+)